jgi:hypothetical protein
MQDFLVLILSGIVEGVVDEKFSGGPHLSHQVRARAISTTPLIAQG